jgi:DNA invertase Pin-like site-specific DNA recombinase
MKYIAYYRVSTRRQGQSGLGLDAQRHAVQQYVAAMGGTLAAEYTEVESGKRSDRPELARALARTRALRGTLIVAKLDRLARNVSFLSALMDSGVEFVACDQPHANRLTIHILAAVAEAEARAISERTKAALQAAKRRGVLLGTHRKGHKINWRKGLAKGRAIGVANHSENAAKRRDDSYGELLADMKAGRKAGESFAAIADRLNSDGHITTGGKQFTAMTVYRLLTA